MSRNYADKLKAIRKAEGMTQKEFAEITGLSLGTIRNYEANQNEAKALIAEKTLQVPKFNKYTMWLMTDTTVPTSVQIAPDLSEIETTEITLKVKDGVPEISPKKAILTSLSTLNDKELKKLQNVLSRKGATFLMELLEQENQDLINLRGFRKFVALMLKDLDDQAVREIWDRIEQKNKGETDALPETMQKTS
ncbi:helix-turn-helix transcriptional regulator (plasmid) [Arsenophonus nasoniae]|uniref:Helix-turn-helix protein n=1 Tax=Arsenophonus nasoniae TaxID=638 RepID=D2U1J9_9GAMM|nr:helix-turn-helix transcriptional regulator [Arsenophonus nasoniae]QBY46991.1 helix-turn-helix protein [Arsenophonus nasoniae]WGM18530.1 helix-turn-helix transcriptional regulator [Arsenophonus nasoniae]CBA74650.1 phage transcriptional regulator [Arsenophonus nasoniae]